MVQVTGVSQYQRITKAVKAADTRQPKNSDTLSIDIDILELSEQGKKKAEDPAVSDVSKQVQDTKTASDKASSKHAVSDLQIAAQRYAALAQKIRYSVTIQL